MAKEYVDRNELIENLNKFAPEHYNALINQLITKQPAADVEEVRHGYWEEIKCGDGIFDYCFKCSNCGKTTPPKAFPVAPDYCPNCPAKMDGGKAE